MGGRGGLLRPLHLGREAAEGLPLPRKVLEKKTRISVGRRQASLASLFAPDWLLGAVLDGVYPPPCTLYRTKALGCLSAGPVMAVPVWRGGFLLLWSSSMGQGWLSCAGQGEASP